MDSVLDAIADTVRSVDEEVREELSAATAKSKFGLPEEQLPKGYSPLSEDGVYVTNVSLSNAQKHGTTPSGWRSLDNSLKENT